MKWHRVPALLLLLVGLVGCGDGKANYPVEFQVRVAGSPADGATVTLHPVDGGAVRPTGKVDASGTVRISTSADGDGAPPGDYTVTIVWFDITSSEERAVIVKGGDRLKGKYSEPTNPDAPKITVKREKNKLPPLDL